MTHRTRLRWARPVALVAFLLLVLGGIDFKASAATTVTFEWAMEERFTDVNGDGVLDERMDAAYLNPTAWNVTFDACGSPAGQNPPANSEFRWTVTRPGSTTRTGTGCRFTPSLDHLGPWTATARQVDKTSGNEHGSSTQTVTMTDKFIVSLGDSIGSGEGNPDSVGARNLGPFPFYEPIWADRECHRTTLAGSAQAARRLERRDPHSSVTFLHLACSGATVEVGLLGEYEGIEPDPTDGMEPPQVRRAIELAAGRPIDALVISIGANNAKFSEIVGTCVKYANCHNFTGIPGVKNSAQIFDENKASVDAGLDKLDVELDKHVAAGKVRNVFLGEYFDPSYADDGGVCKGTTFRERDSLISPDVIEAGAPVADGVSEAEWAWASDTVVKTLNGKVKAATERAANNGGGPWTYIGGVADQFKNNGYCAVNRYVRTLWESFTYQHNKDGAFHPNSEGHLFGLAKQYELAIGPKLGIGGTPLPFDPDPAMAQSASGLASFIGTLDQLNAFTTLSNALPFHGGAKINEGLQTLFDALAQVQGIVANLSNETTQSLTKLDHRLDDLDNDGDTTSDVKIPGLKVDLDATIGPHLPAAKYDVQIKLKVTVDTSDPSLAWLADGMQINGTPLDGKTLVDTTVDFTLEPRLPEPPKRFRMPVKAGPIGSLGFAFEADLGRLSSTVGGDTDPVTFRAGIGDVSATGTMQAEVHADFRFIDPNNDGFLDATEIGPSSLFSVTCGSRGAQIALDVRAAVLGLENSVGKLTLDDPDLCDGVSTPHVALGDLEGFRNLTAADVINGIAQLSTLLQSLQEAGDLDLPFVKDGVARLVSVNERIVKFFVDNELTDPDEPMKNINIPKNKEEALDTLEEIVSKLADKLGVPVAPRWEAGRIVFPVDLAVDPAPFTRAGQLDFDDQLARAGLTNLVNATGGGSITVDPSYSVKLGLGFDLAPGLNLQDRFFIKTDPAAPEAQIRLDAPLTADIDLTGNLAVVTATLKDQNPNGAVTLLEPGVAGAPIVKLEINGGADHRLTLTEATQAAVFPITPVFSAKVPSTTLTATLNVAGCDVSSGALTFGWNNVPDPTGFTVAADGTYTKCYLPLAFDLNDPRAALTQLLDVVRQAIVSTREIVATNQKLVKALPLVGDSLSEIDPLLVKIQDKLDAVIAANQALTLEAVEKAAEDVLGQALGVEPARRGSILKMALEKATSGGGGRPAAVIATVDLGICTEDRFDASRCHVMVAAADQPRLPLSLALGLGGESAGLAGLDSSGRAKVSFDAVAHVVAGLELPTVTPGGPGQLPTVSGSVVPFVRDDTRVELALGLDGVNTFEANLGPAKVAIGTPANPSLAQLAVRYVMDDSAVTKERMALGSTAFSNFLAALPPTVEVGIHETPTVSCGIANGSFDACAKLPVYAGADYLGDILFKAPNILEPGTWTFEGVDQVLAKINPSSLLWSALFEGLDALAERLEAALQAIPPGQPVPLLGSDPTSTAELVKKFREGVLNPVGNLITSLESASGRSQLVSRTQDFFFTRLGPSGSIAPLMRDRENDADALVTKDDVVVDLFCTHTVNNQPVLELCSGADPLSAVERYQVWLPLGLAGRETSPAFDLGFPGLRLASDAGVSASAGFDVDVRFGIDKKLGFYVPTSVTQPAAPSTATATNPEVRLFANASLPNAANGPDLRGDLVFLPVTIEDTHAGPDVDAGVNIDISGGGGDQLLTLQQIDTVALTPSVSACVNLDLDVALTTPELNGQVAPSSMPKLLTNLEVLGGYQCNGGGTNLTINFRDVKIDPGQLFRDFITPAVTEVRKYTGPVEPLVDAIRSEIPGVTDLSKKAGLGPVTWYQAFKESQRLGGQDPASLQMIDRMITFVDLVRTLGSVDPVNGTPAPIPLGNFSVPLVKVVEPVPQTGLAGLVQGSPSDNRSIFDRLSGVNAEVQEDLAAARSQAGGLTFPVLDDPKSLFQVLVGKDVPLVYFDAGVLRAQKTFQASFNWGPAIVYIGGLAKVEGHVAAGFDTYGIRQAVAVLTDDDPDNDNFLSVLDGVIQGFYLDDLNLKGVDVPELRFEAELTAGAGVGVPDLSVGIEGGINGFFDMDLKDPDGRLRFDEMVEQVTQRSPNPLCFFNARTRLTAFLRLAFRNPVKNWYETIVDKVLFEDPDLEFCTIPPPPPAFLHPDGTLELRTVSKPDVITVNYTAAGTATVVTAEATGTFSGVQRLFGDVKGGRDIVTVTAVAGVTAPPSILCGGNAADTITVTSGAATLYGESGGRHQVAGGPLLECAAAGSPGRDILTGGPLADVLHGGGQNDTLIGLAGNDTLNGDDDHDLLYGGDGRDILNGGAGDDHLVGGLGHDTIDGGNSGNDPSGTKIPERDRLSYEDRIAGVKASAPGEGGEIGTSEKDTITEIEILRGGDGPDELTGPQTSDGIVEGGKGDDKLFGGEKRDVLDGGPGNDQLSGGLGFNQLYGREGDDQFLIGPGLDTMIGSEGVDTVDYSSLTGPVTVRVDGIGNDGTSSHGFDNVVDLDVIIGTDADDILVGGRNHERLVGKQGADTLDGGDGNDTLVAGQGNDGLEGGAGNDVLEGGLGDDRLSGGAGNDKLVAAAGDDKLRGGDGDDDLQAGGGADYLEGGLGSDVIDGGGGVDTVDYSGRLDAVTVDVTRPGCDGNALDTAAPDPGRILGCDLDDVRPTVEVILGGLGDDNLTGDGGADTLVGGPGHDTLAGGGGADHLDGGAGNDNLFDVARNALAVDSSTDVMVGGEGDDGIVSHGGGDQLLGGGGDDTLIGGDGVDVIRGGFGNDNIRAGGGADSQVFGEAGDDTILGGSGADTLSGGDGNDSLFGEVGADTLDGGDGDDTLVGAGPSENLTGDLADVIVGGAGNDRLEGGLGDDQLFGGSGHDRLEGGDGNDALDGGTGDDEELGEAGDDRFLQGGSPNGADTMAGGLGYDYADYGSRPVGSVTVKRNGIADDGAAGEADNVLADTESWRRPK